MLICVDLNIFFKNWLYWDDYSVHTSGSLKKLFRSNGSGYMVLIRVV